PERLHDQHDIDATAAEPAMRLGERQAEQAKLGILRPERAAPAIRFLQVSLARIEIVAVAEQLFDAFQQQPLVLAQFEIHQSPNTALLRIFFWISLVPP